MRKPAPEITLSGVIVLRNGLPLFSFPVFQDVIQCHVNCCFQALGHDGHNLFFQNGLLLLLFLLVFLTV